MQIQVLLERTAEGKYRATGLPFGNSIEALTEEEAIHDYREAVASQIRNGSKIVSVELTEEKTESASPVNPWMRFAGTLPDDDLTAEWKAAIEEYRQELDAEDSSQVRLYTCLIQTR